jgi:glutamyl-tRNA synthetase
MDDKAQKLLAPDAKAILGRLRQRLEGVTPWQETALEEAVRGFAEAEKLGLGKVAQPLRAALTGTTASPGIFEVMVVLGSEETLGRIADQAAG